MAINPYTQFLPLRQLHGGFQPLDMGQVIKLGAYQQETAAKNLEDAYALSDLIKYNAIEGTDDVALGKEIQRKYEQEIQNLVANTGDKEYAKMAPKIAALKRNIQKEMATGQIHDINQQRAKYDANIKSLDKQHELYITSGGQKGISPGKYEMYKQKALDDYIKSGAVRGGGAYVDAKPVGTMDIRGHALKLAKEYDLSTKESIINTLKSIGLDGQQLLTATKTLESKGGAANQQAAQELVSDYIAEQLSTDPLYQGYIQEEKDLAAYQAEQGLGRPLNQMERSLIDRDVEYNLIGRTADLVGQSESGTKKTLKTQVVAPRVGKTSSDSGDDKKEEAREMMEKSGVSLSKQYWKGVDDYKEKMSILDKDLENLEAAGKKEEASILRDKIRQENSYFNKHLTSFIADNPDYSQQNMVRPTFSIGGTTDSVYSDSEKAFIEDLVYNEVKKGIVKEGGSLKEGGGRMVSPTERIKRELAKAKEEGTLLNDPSYLVGNLIDETSDFVDKENDRDEAFDEWIKDGGSITDTVYMINEFPNAAEGTLANRIDNVFNSGKFQKEDYEFLIVDERAKSTWWDSDEADAMQGEYNPKGADGSVFNPGGVLEYVKDRPEGKWEFVGLSPQGGDRTPQMEMMFKTEEHPDGVRMRVIPKRNNQTGITLTKDLMNAVSSEHGDVGKAVQLERKFKEIQVPDDGEYTDVGRHMKQYFNEGELFIKTENAANGRQGYQVGLGEDKQSLSNATYLGKMARTSDPSSIMTEILLDNVPGITPANARRLGAAMLYEDKSLADRMAANMGVPSVKELLSLPYNFSTKEEAMQFSLDLDQSKINALKNKKGK